MRNLLHIIKDIWLKATGKPSIQVSLVFPDVPGRGMIYSLRGDSEILVDAAREDAILALRHVLWGRLLDLADADDPDGFRVRLITDEERKRLYRQGHGGAAINAIRPTEFKFN
ncbi:MAG: hypothetical protein PWQ57_2829 [Desulfovibrionales bacterium]|jgi:hypothetical protein|nr:hypothetical protein [Desulfovibrionales bacterium]